jgi:hypothetical protein
MESMMVVSMVNMQLDQLIRHMPKQELPLKSQKNNAFMSCLGFNLEDLDIHFYNKFFTVDSAYTKVEPNSNCE